MGGAARRRHIMSSTAVKAFASMAFAALALLAVTSFVDEKGALATTKEAVDLHSIDIVEKRRLNLAAHHKQIAKEDDLGHSLLHGFRAKRKDHRWSTVGGAAADDFSDLKLPGVHAKGDISNFHLPGPMEQGSNPEAFVNSDATDSLESMVAGQTANAKVDIRTEDDQLSGQDGLDSAFSRLKHSDHMRKLKQDGLDGKSLLGAIGMNDGMMLLQVPKGQDGLQEKINQAKADEAKERARQDGIKGHSLLSASGMGGREGQSETSKYDFDDIEFVQDYEPQGQEGMKSKLAALKVQDAQEDLKEDHLDGTSMLGAVGMGEKTGETKFDHTFDDMELVQEMDWNPKGQEGLDEKTKKLEDDDRKRKEREDHLHGHGLLSSVGIKSKNDFDADDIQFVQDYEPTGQEGLKSKLAALHAAEEKETLKSDGLKGSSLLGSVGMKSHNGDTPGFDNMELVQEMDWNPTGQEGLDAQEKKLKDDDRKRRDSQSGLKGSSLLGSVGMHERTSEDGMSDDFGDIELMQTPPKAWRPNVKLIKSKYRYRHEDSLKKDENEDAESYEAEEPKSILGSVNMKDELSSSKNDEVAKVGADDFGDIKFVQVQASAGSGSGAGSSYSKFHKSWKTPHTAHSKSKSCKACSAVCCHMCAHTKKTRCPGGCMKNSLRPGRCMKKAPRKKIVTKAVRSYARHSSYSQVTAIRNSRSWAPPSKSCDFLKAFSIVAKDKIIDNKKALGAIGPLLIEMGKKRKVSCVIQYQAAMVMGLRKNAHGIGKYTLKHVNKAMRGRGVVTMGPIQGKIGYFIHISGTDLGLHEANAYDALSKIAVRTSGFIKQMAAMKSKHMLWRRANAGAAVSFSKHDYEYLFRGFCRGEGKLRNYCMKKSRGRCGGKCKWVGAWKGDM